MLRDVKLTGLTNFESYVSLPSIFSKSAKTKATTGKKPNTPLMCFLKALGGLFLLRDLLVLLQGKHRHPEEKRTLGL